jgi:chitosanase
MSITPQQKKVIDCVLAIFETGRIPSKASYSTCGILNDNAGISYGKHQCTDRAGSLDLVCKRYIELKGQQSQALSHYMVYLMTNETAKFGSNAGAYPTWLVSLINLLKSAGSDVTMQQAQDEIFDTHYWHPAVTHANNVGLKTALGHLVVYDSTIHSGSRGVTIIRNLFPQKSPANGGDEKEWIYAYINARRNWLLNSPNDLVKRTVYRMDALKAIADANNWDLNTPLTVRGVKIP